MIKHRYVPFSFGKKQYGKGRRQRRRGDAGLRTTSDVINCSSGRVGSARPAAGDGARGARRRRHVV